MNDSFYIGAYWGSRGEPLSDISSKTQKTLEMLSELDEQFTNWYEKGLTREKALENKYLLEPENIEKIYRKAVKKGELDANGFAKNGFVISLWTGHEDYESSSISFTVGDTFNNPALSNSIVIKIPYKGKARERLLLLGNIKAMLSILIQTWNPDYAIFTSHELRDKLELDNKAGWISYYKIMTKIPKPDSGIVYERINGGNLLTITPPFDYDNSLNKLAQLKLLIKWEEQYS